MFATYRIMVERIALFVKISILKEKNVFRWHQLQSFDGGLVRNQGGEKFVLVNFSFKAYCKLHRLAFTWLDAMMDIRLVKSIWLVKNLFWLVNQICH